MPVHDWRRVDAGLFHHFHHGWIEELARALNRGLLPDNCYALAEQIAGGLGPDVLTLQGPVGPRDDAGDFNGAVALATAPPTAWRHMRTEAEVYARKANSVVVRHVSDHRVVAIIELVSPGNKGAVRALASFVSKATELLRAGVHLLVVDLFPSTCRDPQGIHKAIWDEFQDSDFALPQDRPLTVASYIGGALPEAFIEPSAVGLALPTMSLFLTPDQYVPTPLEKTYLAAYDAVPRYWQERLEQG